MNKRGQAGSSIFIAIIIVLLLLGLLWLLGAFGTNVTGELGLDTIGEKIGQTRSFSEVGGGDNEALKFLDYIFGEIPQYLWDLTGGQAKNGVSAAIIMIGIWLLLLLSFADIVKIFSTFNAAVAWVAAAVLTMIAANLNIVKFVAVASLAVTAGFGALSVAVALIGVFVVFIGIQFGSETLRQFAERKKISEMKMRAMMGSKRAAEGLKAAAEFERAAERGR